jgi:acylphosphatase
MKKVRLEAKISGIVQGVGFRYFARHYALTLGLTGFVENLEDGSVYVVAEGEESDVEQYLSILKKGPSSAKISKIEFQYKEPKNEFLDFEVY